jgi:hypothetical protein
MAYSPPREPGFYLEATFGLGDFLYEIGEGKPKYSRFTEMGALLHGMTASGSGRGVRYGGGLEANLESIRQKVCGPTECPDPHAEWERDWTRVLSPFARFEWPWAGLLVGASFTEIGVPLPRLAMRLGPADRVYASLEILNGESFLAEGFFRAGIGGKIGNTEAWMGGDLFPFRGPGLSARAAHILGPVRLILGGRIGRGEVHYIDMYGDDPAIRAQRMEYGGTFGLEFGLPHRTPGRADYRLPLESKATAPAEWQQASRWDLLVKRVDFADFPQEAGLVDVPGIPLHHAALGVEKISAHLMVVLAVGDGGDPDTKEPVQPVQFGFLPGHERPTGKVGAQGGGVSLQHRHRIPIRIHRQGYELDAGFQRRRQGAL